MDENLARNFPTQVLNYAVVYSSRCASFHFPSADVSFSFMSRAPRGGCLSISPCEGEDQKVRQSS
jgi:hypothetical protein